MEREFIREFAPADARSPQQFLHDFDRDVRSFLDAGELERCGEAYGALLQAASTIGTEAVVRVLSASELMLGNAGRALDAGVRFPGGAVVDSLVATIRDVLQRVDQIPALSRTQDAFKRLEALLLVLGQ